MCVCVYVCAAGNDAVGLVCAGGNDVVGHVWMAHRTLRAVSPVSAMLPLVTCDVVHVRVIIVCVQNVASMRLLSGRL